MGMHFGLVAARTSVADFIDMFPKAWTKFEIIKSEANLKTRDDAVAWKQTHEEFVSAAKWSPSNPGKEVYIFWEDGPWAVMMDTSYVLASDEESLKILSKHFEKTISFVVESAGGSACFWCFENGDLRRRISNSNFDIDMSGDPLPEEDGIDIDGYYMDETEALCKAFGLSEINDVTPSKGFRAICVIDRTDYSVPSGNDVFASNPADSLKPKSETSTHKKPWWKIW
ncbi:MAG: hypothetical protein R3C45_00125 [Phycisphaerales bacterium]